MAHTMSVTGIATKNRLSSVDAWLVVVAIDATSLGGTVYYRTSDEVEVTWTGHAYSPVAMGFGEVQENLQGGLPRVDMRVSNLDTVINTAMNTYDGLRGAVVTVCVVPSGNIAANTAELTEVFTVLETSADNHWITFTLGFADPLGRRFPRDRYTTTSCRHVYNGHPTEGLGLFCRLSSTHPLYATECDRSLKHCMDRGNTAQFGGSPGVNEGVYQ